MHAIAIVIGLALGTSSSGALACDPNTARNAAGPVPYQERSGGTYCEGTYALAVASSFEIFSFTVGDIVYDRTQPRIQITAPLSSTGAAVSVRARGRAGAYGYQMDAALLPRQRFDWLTAVALAPLRLQRADIGAFGMRGEGANAVLVPLSVRTGPAATPGSQLIVKLIAPEHIAGNVEYALAPTDGSGQLVWRAASTTSPNKGDVISIVLPGNTLDSPKLFRVRASSRSTPTRRISLVRTLSS